MKKLYCFTTGLILTCFVFGQNINNKFVNAKSKSLAPFQIGSNSIVKPTFPGSLMKTPPAPLYQEDFEGVTPPALPSNMTTTGNTGSDKFQTGTSTTASSQYFAVPAHTNFVFSNDDNCNCDKGNDLLNLPTLNFTGMSNLSVRFSSIMNDDGTATYLDSAYVQVSTDGGTTFTNLFAIPKVYTWSTYTVSLSAYDNMSDVRIRFRYLDLTNWGYGIAIDDISVDAPPAYDIVMTDEITYTDPWQSSYYAKIPKNQVGAMTFTGEVKNNGTLAAPNAKINVDVTKGTSVFNQNSNTATIPVGDSATLVVSQTFSPVDTGTYNVTYTASCDSTDSYTADNVQTLSFRVTDTIFSRDDDNAVYQLYPALFTGIAPVTSSYELGNYFETVNQDTATSISFEIGPSSDAGTTVQGNIYDSAGTLIGQTDFYTILAGDIGTFPAFKTVTLPFQAPAIALTPDNYYIVSIADLSATDSASAVLSGGNNLANWTPGVMMVDGIANIYNISYYPFVRLNTKSAASSPCSGFSVNATSTQACSGNSNGTATAAISGGTTPFSYLWSNSQTGATATGLAAGTFTVTVTDGTGCTVTGSATVSSITITLSTSATGTCSGSSNGTAIATPSGGTTPYSYLWSNSQTGQTANNLAAGTYNVTVTDLNGCTSTGTATVSAVTISATAAPTNTTCGYNNGAATANATGGTSPYSYLWSNAQTTQTVDSLTAGSYSVTITDSQGCTNTATANIGSSTALSVVANSTNAACGAADGSATVTSPTGTQYTYLWSSNAGNQTTATADSLSAGSYVVTVTDTTGGCLATSVVSVNNTGAAALSTTKTDVDCNGDTSGTIDLTLTGGTGPFSYSWTNGDTTQDVSGLGAGTYIVTVTGSGGCISTISTVVNEPTAITANLVSTGVSCNGGANGSVNLLASGGSTPLTYAWSNSVTTEDLSNIAAGTYTVTITDAKSCKKIDSVTVAQPSAIALTMTVTNALGNTGAINLSVSGGTSGYTFSWNTNPVQTTEDISGLAAGTYSVTVMDANGCTSDTSATVISVGIVEEVVNSSFSVFPNPNKGIFSMQFNNARGLYSIELRNIIGQVIYSDRVTLSGNSTRQMDLSNIGQGIYFLSVSGSEMSNTQKVIIR